MWQKCASLVRTFCISMVLFTIGNTYVLRNEELGMINLSLILLYSFVIPNNLNSFQHKQNSDNVLASCNEKFFQLICAQLIITRSVTFQVDRRGNGWFSSNQCLPQTRTLRIAVKIGLRARTHTRRLWKYLIQLFEIFCLFWNHVFWQFWMGMGTKQVTSTR